LPSATITLEKAEVQWVGLAQLPPNNGFVMS